MGDYIGLLFVLAGLGAFGYFIVAPKIKEKLAKKAAEASEAPKEPKEKKKKD